MRVKVASARLGYAGDPLTKVLITGGCGFIGSHLVYALLDNGHAVSVLDNFATGRREHLAPVLGDIELIEGDIQSYERAHSAVRGCDVVLHQAALPSVPRSVQDPLTTNAVNVVGTLNLLLAARDSGVRRVVMASSSSIYGTNPELPKREDLAPAPISPYAVGKLAAEGYCRAFAEVYGMETVALRYFNVFGPRQDPLSQYSAVIPRFITAALTGARATVYGDGTQTRDFTYVANVVDANLRAMASPVANGHIYNIACGGSVSLNTLIREIEEIAGRPVAVDQVAARAGEVLHSVADITRAREDLGYEPATSLSDGLRVTIEHYAALIERGDVLTVA